NTASPAGPGTPAARRPPRSHRRSPTAHPATTPSPSPRESEAFCLGLPTRRAEWWQAVPIHTWPGNPYPLGATFTGSGTNFAVYSSVADRVELCLIDDSGKAELVATT